MDVTANPASPPFRLLRRFAGQGIVGGDKLQQSMDGFLWEGRSGRIVSESPKQGMGIAALGQHIARLAQDVFRHKAIGFGHRCG